jgi:hypothetical protein
MRPEYSLSAWEQEGFTEDSARLWAELGLSPSDALSFDEAGFSVEEARPWVEAGFKNAKRCKKWREAGFRPEETKVYESFGLHIEHAKRLKAWGIMDLHLSPYRGQTKLTDSLNNLLRDLDSLKANPHSPPEWVSELLNDSELSSVLADELEQKYRYFHEPTHSDLLRALGGELASAMVEQLTPDLLIEAAQQEVSAAELLKPQVYGVPLKDYLKYRPHGLSLEQARELIQAGVKPEDFAENAEQGLTYAEILEVFRRGVNLSEYLHFRKYGIAPEQAEELLQAGVKSKDYAKGVEQGPTFAEILEVFRRGVNLSEYLHFRKCELTSEQAEKLLQAGVKPENYARGVEQGLSYSGILEVFQRKVNLDEYLYLRKYGITLRESTFVAQGLQQIAIEGPLSVSSPLIIENSSLTLKNLSLKTLRVSDSQVILEGCSFPNGGDFPSPRLEIVSSEVALEGVRIEGGEVGIHVRGSRLTLREVSLTGLGEVGMRVEGQTAVEGDLLSIRQCGRGMEVRQGAKVQLTRPTLTENGTGIVVEGADLVLKRPGKLTHHQGPAIIVEKNGSLSAENLTFEENQGSYSIYEAQIRLLKASKVSLQRITVQNSKVIGLYAKDCSHIRITNSIFTSNLGGAIRLAKSRLIASEVEILENGGIDLKGREHWQVGLSDHAFMKIEKSSIEDGAAGGIWANCSKVKIADCIVAHHQSDGLRILCSSTAKVVGGTFRANLRDQIVGYNSSKVQVRDAVLDGDGRSQRGLYMKECHVAIKKCQIYNHNQNGVQVWGGSGCTIEDSQLKNNGLPGCPQLFVKEVEKVALSDLRVIGGKGEGVYLGLCENASLSGKSIIRGNQRSGLLASETQLTVEKAEFQDNGKGSTPDKYYYQIVAGDDSNVHLKEVRICEGQHSGGLRCGGGSTVKLEGGSIHGHGREAIRVGSKIVVIGARIFGNAQEGGAQVRVEDSGTAEMEDTCIQDSPHGGALVEDGGTLILKSCQVHNNNAQQTGAQVIVKDSGTAKMEDTRIQDSPHGGVLVEDGGTLILKSCQIHNNNAQQTGAQVIVKDSGTAKMEDTCIQDSPHGGALVKDGGTLILKKCQVHNNKAYNLRREGTGRVEFIDMPPVKD